MKLRIKGNSLRIRVTRSELARILAGEQLRDTIRFGGAPEASFGYALGITEQDAPIRVEYAFQTATVHLSREAANTWKEDDEVGIYSILPLALNLDLDVAVEKDFACLDRNDAENVDAFENPIAAKSC